MLSGFHVADICPFISVIFHFDTWKRKRTVLFAGISKGKHSKQIKQIVFTFLCFVEINLHRFLCYFPQSTQEIIHNRHECLFGIFFAINTVFVRPNNKIRLIFSLSRLNYRFTLQKISEAILNIICRNSA